MEEEERESRSDVKTLVIEFDAAIVSNSSVLTQQTQRRKEEAGYSFAVTEPVISWLVCAFFVAVQLLRLVLCRHRIRLPVCVLSIPFYYLCVHNFSSQHQLPQQRRREFVPTSIIQTINCSDRTITTALFSSATSSIAAGRSNCTSTVVGVEQDEGVLAGGCGDPDI